MRAFLVGTILLLISFTATGQSTAIALGDLATWQIVCSDQEPESAAYAATEFQTLYEGATGTTLPIVAAPTAGTPSITIHAEADGELGEEGLRISVASGAIAITGGAPRGVIYAVYEFFEELCGVRFLTADHTWYPADALAIQLPLGDHSYIPPFSFRWSYYGETNRNPAFAARLRVNTVDRDRKLGGRTGYRLVSHNVAYLVPPDKYGAEHPEYYALVDGQRKLDMHGGGPQLCMTNPAVLDIVVDAVLHEIEENPRAKNINVAHMDNEAYCTCDNCAAIDAREESHAGATLNFVNQVAERIEKTHPDVLISTYAYQYTRKPPKTIRARHNVMIQLCSIECCDFHAIDDASCALNRQFCEDTNGWKPIADHIFIWHYNTNFRGYLLPFPNLRAIGKSVAYYHDNNGQGIFMQAAGNGYSTELSDLRNYVMARCLWKPGRDSWAEAMEFCSLHYGEAAQPIIDYLTWYHDHVDKLGTHPTCFPTEAALGIDPASARAIMGYFQKAMALAQSDAVKARVEKASLCAYRAVLSAAEMKLIYADGICKPDLSGVDPAILEQYASLCEKYDVPMENEHTTKADYLANTRKLHAGLAASMIENDTWRVIALPEYNGKIIEMTYKPTNRNVAYASRALDRFRFEEWVRQGEGPGSQNIVPFNATIDGNAIVLTHTTPDGSEFTRRIEFDGDAVRFSTRLVAGIDRIADFYIHPEYDVATFSDDPATVGLYVKNPNWIQANKDWAGSIPTEDQTAAIKTGVAGGAFAYYNKDAGFGVEQTFDPAAFQRIDPFWGPSRRQVNLELFPIIRTLAKGETAEYVYTVRYLAEDPAP